jgi:hypothetical protein
MIALKKHKKGIIEDDHIQQSIFKLFDGEGAKKAIEVLEHGESIRDRRAQLIHG